MTTEWKEITDPEELFHLKKEGWDIEFANSSSQVFAKWSGLAWHADRQFRARPTQPKMKKVKLLAYLDQQGEFRRVKTGMATNIYWTRAPSEDKEIEVPDDN